MQIKPTAYGLLTAGGLVLMLASTFILKSNFGMLLVFTLFGFFCASLMFAVKNLAGLEITPQAVEAVFAGEALNLQLSIRSTHKIRYALGIAVEGADRHLSILPVGKTHPLTFALATRTRGQLHIPPVTVGSHYPLGLVRVLVQIDLGLTGIVYPRPLPVVYEETAVDGEITSTKRQTFSDSDEFNGLRAYQPGDPLSRLYWKALARNQGLLTKEFSGQAAPAKIFRYQRLETVQGVEDKLSALCYLVVEADRQHKSFGLELPGQRVDVARGKDHLARCLRALALFKPQEHQPHEH
jgi:uncharacterized protein (DUF58 family)